METPHYLRFVRALTLVAGAAGCSDSTASAPDASPDVSADTAPMPDARVDVVAPSDVATDAARDVSVDTVIAADVRADAVAPDVTSDVTSDVSADAPRDVSPPIDAVADTGGTTDAGADVADADPCPMLEPARGASCDTAGLSCMYTPAGGGFTSCMCVDMAGVKTWQCFTAVPGPLPPPELLA